MSKKYQIFISSTYEDLKEERRKVQDTILSMHHFPIGMEMFSAANEEQWEIIQETIDSSDYYVLIIGYRYGSIIKNGKDEGISYTQKEFRYAVSQGIPVLAFFIDEKNVAVTPEKMEHDANKKVKLEEFKKEVMTGRMVEWWTSKEDLAQKVSIALINEMNRVKRPGWMRQKDYNVQHIGISEQNITEFGIKQVPLEDMLKRAKKEIYIFGNTLASLHDEKNNILDLLNAGVEVKLLAMDLLDEKNYKRNCDYLGANTERMKKSSESAILRLGEIKSQYSGDKLVMKVTSFPVAIGIVAVDIEEDGMIIATHLLPVVKSLTRDCLIAKICKDNVFYERYKEYIKRCWNERTQLVDQQYYDKLIAKNN